MDNKKSVRGGYRFFREDRGYREVAARYASASRRRSSTSARLFSSVTALEGLEPEPQMDSAPFEAGWLRDKHCLGEEIEGGETSRKRMESRDVLCAT
jgi:hypothetical protein